MSEKLVRMLSTFFYVGESPFAPGSMASVVGALIAIILSPWPLLYIAVFAIITFYGFKVSGRMEEICGEKDPSKVVIDEVSGVMIAFFCLPLQWPVIITAFFLFRAFDMFKLYPVNRFENPDFVAGLMNKMSLRNVEQHKHTAGIMMDDIIAGVYTFVVMQFAIRFAGII
tara:strand:- start:248 stop:757 length:510 start_codon:yes stop_codon:yes gene_type:complete